MAPTTSFTSRITPPPGPFREHEADTMKKTRFYTAYDKEIRFKSVRQIAYDSKTPESTARRLLKQRENMGSLAYRTTRMKSHKLRRPSKVTKSISKMLIDLAKNPIRDQLYEAQIAYCNIPVKKRQLQRKLKKHTVVRGYPLGRL